MLTYLFKLIQGFNRAYTNDAHLQGKIHIVIITSLSLVLTLVSYLYVNQIYDNYEYQYDPSEYKGPTRVDWKPQASKMNNTYYLSDGDYWVTQQNWKNAYFQYNLAYQRNKIDINILFRLTYVSAQLCRTENSKCNEAERLINLLKDHPGYDADYTIQTQLQQDDYSHLFNSFSPTDHWSHLKVKRTKAKTTWN